VKKKVLVLGSANIDYVLRIPRFHAPGETLTGKDLITAFGGKGANQAVAARLLGAKASFVSKLGEDLQGKSYRRYLRRRGFDPRFLLQGKKTPTGVAVIEISPDGENRIIVSPGANGTLSPADLEKTAKAWQKVNVFVSQLEIPLETVRAGLEMAKKQGALTILNPAPAKPLPYKILSLVDFLVPNETETRLLTGKEIKKEEDLSKAGSELIKGGVGNVVITLGERGVFFKNRQEEIRMEAFKIKAVDTTASGDAFVGALAWGLAEGKSIEEGLIYAGAAGALTATRLGAQSSLPSRREVEGFLKKRRRS
jgi:ribokinase